MHEILSDRPVSHRVTWVTLLRLRAEVPPVGSLRCRAAGRCALPCHPRAAPAVVVAPGGAQPPKREPRGGPRVRAVLSRAVPFVAAIAAAVPATAPAAEPGERTLERGDRGDDVRALQELLTKLDLPTGADGFFGASTVTHVKSYERREDLPADG